MKLIFLIAIFILCGCTKDGKPQSVEGAIDNFSVEFLFKKDDCSIFRFIDSGYHHYFVNCNGNTSSLKSCGKNCHYSDEINTRK